MRTTRALRLAALCCVCAGCFDFLEPDFPEAGAPAVLQAAVYVDEQGNVNITGLLVPGLAIGGVQRTVRRDTLDVYGLKLAPTAVRRNGSREYSFIGKLPFADPVTVPFELEAPAVEDVTGPPPRVRWFGFQKVGADTIAWTRGTPLVLRVETDLGASVPAPTIRQWFLELRGSDRSFRISSDGFPPETLSIPSEWVPSADDDEVTATLTLFQSGQPQSPSRDYIGNIAWNVQLVWVIRVTPP